MNYIKIALSLSILCALPAQAMLRIAQRAGSFRAPRIAASKPQTTAPATRGASAARIAAAASSPTTPARSIAAQTKRESAAARTVPSMPFSSLKAGFKGKHHGNSQKITRNFNPLFVGAVCAFTVVANASLTEKDKTAQEKTDFQYTQKAFFDAIVNNDLETVKIIANRLSYLLNEYNTGRASLPLDVACGHSSPQMVELLLSLGANHKFAFSNAVNSSYPKEIIQILLDHDVKPTMDAYYAAIQRGEVFFIEAALNNNGYWKNNNFDSSKIKAIPSGNLTSTLHKAISFGLKKTVEELIVYADLRATNYDGKTAIEAALASQKPMNEEIIKLINTELVRTQK